MFNLLCFYLKTFFIFWVFDLLGLFDKSFTVGNFNINIHLHTLMLY